VGPLQLAAPSAWRASPQVETLYGPVRRGRRLKVCPPTILGDQLRMPTSTPTCGSGRSCGSVQAAPSCETPLTREAGVTLRVSFEPGGVQRRRQQGGLGQ
jgi:hypothetical protein